MQSTNILHNVEIEVTPGVVLSGGSYPINTLKENLERFQMSSPGGVISAQGEDENGNIVIWDNVEEFSVIGSKSAYPNIKSISKSDLEGQHVMDKAKEWGHGKIVGLEKNERNEYRVRVNFPINADQGWEITMPLSQIKQLPNKILAEVLTKENKLVYSDITSVILNMTEVELLGSVEDQTLKFIHPLIADKIIEDHGSKNLNRETSDVKCVQNTCEFFGKKPYLNKDGVSLPDNLIDDSIHKQVIRLFHLSSNDMTYNGVGIKNG